MASNSKIEWTDDTWNPVTGCTKVSTGCDKCYAETFAERWRGTPGHYFEQGFDVQLRPDKLDQPLRWKKSRNVFVNSMSDLFHKDVPDEYIAQVFAVMSVAQRHTFQILTKRPARMRSLLSNYAWWTEVVIQALDLGQPGPTQTQPNGQCALLNVLLGVSVEDQKHADLRIPPLLETPAAKRFLSCEPLLGPVDLRNLTRGSSLIDCLGGDVKSASDGAVYTGTPSIIDWVIVGGESGHGARPMHPDWARDLRDQCKNADAAFFMKQAGAVLAKEWGCSSSKGTDPTEWPEPFPREFPSVD